MRLASIRCLAQSFHFFVESFSLNLELTDLTGLTGQQGPGILLSVPPQKCLAFKASDGDLNSGLHSLSSRHFLQTNTSVPGPFVHQSYSLWTSLPQLVLAGGLGEG